MDIFAYTVLGLAGLGILAWGGALLVGMLSSTIGRAILMGYAILLLVACAFVLAVWLAGTKLL